MSRTWVEVWVNDKDMLDLKRGLLPTSMYNFLRHLPRGGVMSSNRSAYRRATLYVWTLDKRIPSEEG